MKSLVVDKDGQLAIREIAKPVHGEYQALVKMVSCGICRGTDMKLIHGEFKGFDTYPAVLGHEGVGRVVETGARVRHLQVGDLVLLPFLEGVTDGVHSGWGAFSEYAVVGDSKSLLEDGKGPGYPEFSEAYYAQQRLPHDIDITVAPMIITFREVLSACKRFGFRPNASVVVFGAGPVGLTFITFAKLLGMGPIIASVTSDAKVEEALQAGAHYAFNSKQCDLTAAVRNICHNGVDFSVDAVGKNEIINQSMELLAPYGHICCYGISPETQMRLDWSKAPYNWHLDFIQWPSKLEESESHLQVMNWIACGVLKPEAFVSTVFDFDRILDAFELVGTNSGLKKTVITFK
ncbi:zinc-binding dehydrogenase [Paenibacillus sp. HWE-109]|uniref:zinc-dependent alcohol dehydrogenase n=1 Tax=Paenibacillus sp. HWE-109 TaxID=1306526 RepID=UPI001EDCBAED|nr:zinc-binding dehydrogenase [Paenibacillus sp. HWE-109]UKS28274.1 zinc-binding dehydrogenase [Paenibacillus sp. HWE-109]